MRMGAIFCIVIFFASKPMISSQSFNRPGLYRATLIALALLPVGCGGENQPAGKAPPTQTPAAQPASAPSAAPPPAVPATPIAAAAANPLSEIESLVAPIALYPDPLLAELLVASTYPLEVVQAARWLDSKPDLATLKDKDWDPSIMRLVDVPQVLKMMNDHLDWTTRLGDSFLAQPEALMNAVQDLRRRAKQSGFLKDTPEQKVSVKTESVREAAGTGTPGGTATIQPAVVKKEVVYIEPAKSDTVYVPQYNPEQAYSAPLAPAPASTAAYPAAAPAASGYYPAYYPPATATATTSGTDQLLTFGAGALVGGLLTWGIMEWADNDDWDDHYRGGYYPPVSHYYGGAVCRSGNCWNGGGNWDRGNVNYNKNVNVSGNEVNIDRGRTINQANLSSWKQERQGWTPEARHRRGQQFPAEARKRLGSIQQPGLAGDRLGSAQTLPANVRGFGDNSQGPNRPSTLPAERRPSSDEVRRRLGQDSKLEEKFGGKLDQNRPATRDIQQRSRQGDRPNALEGLGEGGRQARIEDRRGEASRGKFQPGQANRGEGERPKLDPGRRQQIGQSAQGQQARNETRERRAEPPQRQERPRAQGGGRDFSQARDQQKRAESARPNAFEGARDPSRTQDFSRRGQPADPGR